MTNFSTCQHTTPWIALFTGDFRCACSERKKKFPLHRRDSRSVTAHYIIHRALAAAARKAALALPFSPPAVQREKKCARFAYMAKKKRGAELDQGQWNTLRAINAAGDEHTLAPPDDFQ